MGKQLDCKVCGLSTAVPDKQLSVVCPDCARRAQIEADFEEISEGVPLTPELRERWRSFMAFSQDRTFFVELMRMAKEEGRKAGERLRRAQKVSNPHPKPTNRS